jgi:hypothetical protein
MSRMSQEIYLIRLRTLILCFSFSWPHSRSCPRYTIQSCITKKGLLVQIMNKGKEGAGHRAQCYKPSLQQTDAKDCFAGLVQPSEARANPTNAPANNTRHHYRTLAWVVHTYTVTITACSHAYMHGLLLSRTRIHLQLSAKIPTRTAAVWLWQRILHWKHCKPAV